MVAVSPLRCSSSSVHVFSGVLEFNPGFQLGFVDCCLYLLYLFFQPLCCLSIFNLRILITPLLSSSSFYSNIKIQQQFLCSNIKCIFFLLFIKIKISNHLPYLTSWSVVAVIVWQLDLQLPMQSVPITTDVVSSNLRQSEVYNIM